jgi:GNAT superfamily N-acetyltransferase
VRITTTGNTRGGSRKTEPDRTGDGACAVPGSFTVVDQQGCEALFRPLVQADRPTVARLFWELSAQTRFHRFNSLYAELDDEQLTALFDLDYCDRFAWAIEITCDGVTVPVAVGRYARYRGSRRADVAITIRDQWQGRGLGGLLLDTLVITAHHHGFVAFATVVTADNEAMLHLMRKRGAELSQPRSGEVDVVLPLSEAMGSLTDHPLCRLLITACTARTAPRKPEPGLRAESSEVDT